MNFFIYKLERNRCSQVHYYPPAISIDPNSRCNLKCPACPTGMHHPEKRKNSGLAYLETMTNFISKSYKYTVQIGFYNWGEPLLNKEFYDACSYARKKGLWTLVHSNLSFQVKDFDFAKKNR
jgi:MoaA/NifB/PqqE/SkfB family radical SAM enzyme